MGAIFGELGGDSSAAKVDHEKNYLFKSGNGRRRRIEHRRRRRTPPFDKKKLLLLLYIRL